LASNVNFRSDHTVAGAAIVPIGADGTICVYTSSDTHLIVDVMGSFAGHDSYIRAGPTRLTDTRELGDAGLVGHEPLRVKVPDSVKNAAVLNVTAVGGSSPGFVTVYRCGDPIPGTSNVNFPAGGIVPNLVVAQPDANGEVCLYANQPTHLVVDLFGGLAPSAVTLHSPVRVVDTRGSAAAPGNGAVVTAATGGQSGVLANLTTTQSTGSGFLTAFPCGQPMPPTSNLNVVAQQTVANIVTVAPSVSGDICVFTSSSAQVIVDVAGEVGTSFAGLAVPARAFDSRQP
jgi:hypothetical protein